MKKIWIRMIAVLVVAAIAAVWYLFVYRKGRAVIYENGTARTLDKDEARRIQQQIRLPGDDRAAAAVPASADIRKNLDTIEQVNRINRINSRQKR